MAQLPHILPDYMLVFAVPVLTHCPLFESRHDIEQLHAARTCLWFILEALIVKNESYCYGFYKELIDKMKNHVDACCIDDNVNEKMWALCDLALGTILARTTTFEMKDFPAEPRITAMYFKKPDDPNFVNTAIYLPPELQYQQTNQSNSKKGLSNMTMNAANTTKVSKAAAKKNAAAANNTAAVKPNDAKADSENGEPLPKRRCTVKS